MNSLHFSHRRKFDSNNYVSLIIKIKTKWRKTHVTQNRIFPLDSWSRERIPYFFFPGTLFPAPNCTFVCAKWKICETRASAKLFKWDSLRARALEKGRALKKSSWKFLPQKEISSNECPKFRSNYRVFLTLHEHRHKRTTRFREPVDAGGAPSSAAGGGRDIVDTESDSQSLSWGIVLKLCGG